MSLVTLDTLEFRSPLANAEFKTRDGRTLSLPASVDPVWQRRLKSLWAYVQQNRQPVSVASTRQLTGADRMPVLLLASGTVTLTLPAAGNLGDSYYIFNNDVGVITIDGGTINGSAGYSLATQYKYAEITLAAIGPPLVWILTGAN